MLTGFRRISASASLACFTSIALALIASAPRADAQIRIAGVIAGTVTDSSDAVVPGAAVQLVDELTGIPKETVTNASGGFQLPDLSFGSYKVTVTLEGLQKAVLTNVIVESSRKAG